MGWLKYSNEIPDPKIRRFQELNGIKSDALRASVGLKLTANSETTQPLIITKMRLNICSRTMVICQPKTVCNDSPILPGKGNMGAT